MRFTPSRILILIAVILFVLAAFNITLGGEINLIALGLAFWAAAQLVGR